MSEETKAGAHTPGKWEAWKPASSINEWVVRSVYYVGKTRMTAFPAVCRSGNQDNEANARLIARAPELLDANAQLRDEVDKLRQVLRVIANTENRSICPEDPSYADGYNTRIDEMATIALSALQTETNGLVDVS